MDEYIYRIQPSRDDMLRTGPTETEAQIVSDHFAYLQKLTEAGIVLLAGRTLVDDHASFGIVIFRARSEEDAQKLVTDDPAVQKGVMLAQLFPFRIALMGSRSTDSA